jgi:hypothetical protein
MIIENPGKSPLLAQKKSQQRESGPLSSENIGEKLKASYMSYKKSLQEESPQATDSILERLTAEKNYYTTRQTALNKGWMEEKDITNYEYGETSRFSFSKGREGKRSSNFTLQEENRNNKKKEI